MGTLAALRTNHADPAAGSKGKRKGSDKHDTRSLKAAKAIRQIQALARVEPRNSSRPRQVTNYNEADENDDANACDA